MLIAKVPDGIFQPRTEQVTYKSRKTEAREDPG